MVRICIDAMGGDYAPEAIVQGCLDAVRDDTSLALTLFGKEEAIMPFLQKAGAEKERICIVDCADVIENNEHPVQAVRRKKEASVVKALRALADGEGDGFVGAGSTGAVLAGATLIVKRIEGILRPALAPMLPTVTGTGVLLIDCGANVECTPQYLLQFAYMGACYTEFVRGVKSPRIGLLNNGTEKTKGTQLQIDTYELLEEARTAGKLNFIGNVEAKDVMHGVCDVVVCDGYSGNVLLKATEGAASFVMKEIKKTLTSSFKTKMAALLVRKEVYDLKERMSADKIGGTALLGISKPVIKAHGSSNAAAIKSAIRQAIDAANSNMAEILQKNIAE